MPTQLKQDERFMRMALALGRRGLGQTWPNPAVGAVIVAGGHVIAQGATQRGGRPHAERVALAKIGAAARGSTIYVTLEPCSHHGKTPPCVDALLEAGVTRVVTPLTDPDSRVAGRSHALLRENGIDVTQHILAEEAFRLHRGHILRVTIGRPNVMVKVAQTLDGYAAGLDGERLMITGAKANAHVHMLRMHADVIMVGVETVIKDDPQLNVRLPGLEARSPLPIVLDSSLRIPLTSFLVQSARQRPLWVITTEKACPKKEKALIDQGVDVIRVASQEGRVDLTAALKALALRGVTRILCEGGPSLIESLAAAQLIDEAVIITSPQTLQEAGLAAIGPYFRAALADDLVPLAVTGWGQDQMQHCERPQSFYEKSR
jgi:diaminohydroxyphosphoribosylaminopyrimidine deaminase / 5-amino-6-(5-phosphoribosylamino)uracil reductase